MYIGRTVLSHVKGFSELDLDFASNSGSYPGWAVVTGDNGSGKTALLRAISLAILGPDQSRGILPDLSGWITDGADRATISVEIIPHGEYDKTLRGGYPVKSSFWAEVEIIAEGRGTSVRVTDIFRNKKKGAANGPWPATTSGWFALAYGPFRRLYGSSPDAQRLMVIPGRIPHFATLFKEDATLAEGEEWIKQLAYVRLEHQVSTSPNSKNPEVQALSDLLDLIGDDFLRQGMSIESVRADGIHLRDAAGRLIPLEDMSEGYRSALAMLVDIFRNMVQTYGIEGLVRREGDSVYVDRPGVVMIDEIDAHLHPRWQREIGDWMKRHFPLVQFIVTTHSPIVCQSADGGRVYHVPEPESGQQPFQLSQDDYETIITGRSDEVLLTPAFGMDHTRSIRAVRARRRHAQLRAKAKSGLSLNAAESAEIEELTLFALPSGEA